MKRNEILMFSLLLLATSFSFGQNGDIYRSDFDGISTGEYAGYSHERYDKKYKSIHHLYNSATHSERSQMLRLYNRLYERLDNSWKDGKISKREGRRLAATERGLDVLLHRIRTDQNINGGRNRQNRDFIRNP